VANLREQLGDAKTFFLVDYQGLSADDLGKLRGAVSAAGGKILVAKNTLINVVLKEQGVEGFDEMLKGPTALVLVGEEMAAPVQGSPARGQHVRRGRARARRQDAHQDGRPEPAGRRACRAPAAAGRRPGWAPAEPGNGTQQLR